MQRNAGPMGPAFTPTRAGALVKPQGTVTTCGRFSRSMARALIFCRAISAPW
jgi:hypothetical protein